jgi:hypothetical protein
VGVAKLQACMALSGVVCIGMEDFEYLNCTACTRTRLRQEPGQNAKQLMKGLLEADKVPRQS